MQARFGQLITIVIALEWDWPINTTIFSSTWRDSQVFITNIHRMIKQEPRGAFAFAPKSVKFIAC